jgi:hypothetical protein
VFRRRRGPTRDRGAAAAPRPPEPAPPSAEQLLAEKHSAEQLYDALVARLGFDTAKPGWSPALRELHKRSREKRLQVVPEFFYTPVWSPALVPEPQWQARFDACGQWDVEKQRAFLRETPAFPEVLGGLPWDPPQDPSVFHWNNDQFSHSDAALYYTLLRRFRPRRVVEVGAGHSTKLAAKALADEGAGSILCIDPNAPAWLATLGARVEVMPVPVQEAPDAAFLSLAENDVLFVDGSHISKTGSDVNHLFLRILPRLPAGVVVHVHDICLPFEYPRRWAEDVLCYWNEQYVLAALLANSTKFEILAGNYFLQNTDIEALRPFGPRPEIAGVFPGGGSLWLRATY